MAKKFTAKINGINGNTYTAKVSATQIAESFTPEYDGTKKGNIAELKYDTVKDYHNYVVSLCPSMKYELDKKMTQCFNAMEHTDEILWTNGVTLTR